MSSDDESVGKNTEINSSDDSDNEFKVGLGFSRRRQGQQSAAGNGRGKISFLKSSRGNLVPDRDSTTAEMSGSSSEDDKGRIDDENSDAGEFDDIICGLGASASSSSNKKTGASNADFRQAFLSSGNNSGLGTSAVNGNKSSSSGSSSSPPPATVTIDPSLGQWEKHTKGFGMAMLKKMGFTGRLGAGKDGIAKAVEVDYRPEPGQAHGVGFGKKKPKTKGMDESTRKFTSALKGAKPMAPQRPANKKKKTKVVFFGEAGDATGGPPVERIDMRGPEGDKVRGVFGQELIYNLEALRESTEKELERARSMQVDQSRRRQALRMDIASSKKVAEAYRDLAARQQALHTTLSDLHTRDASKTLSVASLSVTFADLYKNYPSEFSAFKMWTLLEEFGAGVVAADLTDWLQDPFADPSYLLQHFQKWDTLLKAIDSRGDPKAAHNVYALYERACTTELRRRVLNDWSPRNEEDIGIALLRCVKLVFSDDGFQAFCKTVLVPKLMRAVAAHGTGSRAGDMHEWLLPWREVLGDEFNDVLPEVRHRLAQVMGKLVEKDEAGALTVLQPWVGVLSKKEMDNLATKAVAPVLASKMGKIDFSRADKMSKVEGIMALAPLLPGAFQDALFLGEFFPSFCAGALTVFTSDGPRAAGDLYSYWRKAFPSHVIRRRRIYMAFSTVLNAMADLVRQNQDATHGVAGVAGVVIPPSSYKEALATIRNDDSAHKAFQQVRAVPRPAITFKDVVQEHAAVHDLPFYPDVGLPHSKAPYQQVWRLGTNACYMDRDVLFVLKNGEFRPTALDTLGS